MEEYGAVPQKKAGPVLELDGRFFQLYSREITYRPTGTTGSVVKIPFVTSISTATPVKSPCSDVAVQRTEPVKSDVSWSNNSLMNMAS